MPPNPANPNAQDQFMDAVQGPANQAQGPAVQNQVQGPAQVGQTVPMQPPQQPAVAHPGPVGPVVPVQPAPVQPVPVGPAAPAPQVFYQNWMGRNLNSQVNLKRMLYHIFSVLEIGWKPTTFQMKLKLDICLTLIGEARLWYESLAPLDDDWQAYKTNFDGNIKN